MSSPNLEFITRFCYCVNQLFIQDEELKLENIASKLRISIRSLNRYVAKNTGMTPVSLINLIRFQCAYTKLRNGEEIDNILFSIKVDSLSYFYKKFKQYFNIKPTEIKLSTKRFFEFEIILKSTLCCNIETYKYYCKSLHNKIAHLLCHEDFMDITIRPINIERIYDALQTYLILDFSIDITNRRNRLRRFYRRSN